MFFLNRAVLVMVAVFGWTGTAGAAGTTGAPVLRVPQGARPEAMGGAYTGVSDDLSALFWNPAGLASVTAPECSALYTSWLAGTSTSCLGYAGPLGALGTLAGAASMLDYGSQPRTVADADGLYGGTSGTVSARDTFAVVGWGRRVPGVRGLDAGAALKVVVQRFAGQGRSGLGADLGALWTTPVRGLRAGLAAQNLGVMTSGSALLPMTWRAGAAWETPMGARVRAIWAADGEFTAEAGTRVHAGVEVAVFDLVALRGGWRGGAIAGGPTFGAGLIVPGAWLGLGGALRIDYAGGQADELGLTHRVQLLFRFGARNPAARAAGFKVETIGGERWLVWSGGPGPWEITVRRPGESRGEGAPLGGGLVAETRCPLASLAPGAYLVAVRRMGGEGSAWQRELPVDVKISLPALAKTAPAAPAAPARAAPVFPPLTPPSGLKVLTHGKTVSLEWEGVGPDYFVFIRPEGGKFTKLESAPLGGARIALPPLNPGSYGVVIRAYDPNHPTRKSADSPEFRIFIQPRAP